MASSATITHANLFVSKSFPQSSHSTNATTINANILAFVHFKGNTKKAKEISRERERKREWEGTKKPLQINANGITEKRYTSEESGTDTSRKLYLHHLHIKLVCTTATAAGHMDNMDKCCMQHQQLERNPTKPIHIHIDILIHIHIQELPATLTYINTLSHKSQFSDAWNEQTEGIHFKCMCAGFCTEGQTGQEAAENRREKKENLSER